MTPRMLPSAIVAAVSCWCMAAGSAAAPAASTSAQGSDTERLARALNDQGVALAMAGRTSSAESTFVLLLSQRRGDARAYNNLGNLCLMNGYYAVALAYYDSALRGDSSDAGVHLNRAAVHLLLGEEDEALRQAALASQLAGGAEQAGELLGLRDEADSSRAAEKKVLSQEDMRALLKKASKAVPSGKPAPPQSENKEHEQGHPTPVWRNGATRATKAPGDAADAASVLYWKR